MPWVALQLERYKQTFLFFWKWYLVSSLTVQAWSLLRKLMYLLLLSQVSCLCNLCGHKASSVVWRCAWFLKCYGIKLSKLFLKTKHTLHKQATPDGGLWRSESARDYLGKFIYQFQSETKTLIRKLERILNKLNRQNLSLLFNETYSLGVNMKK